MVQVIGNIQDLDGIATRNPDGANVEVALHTYRVDSDDILTTKSFTVPVINGYADFIVEPSALGSAYRIRFYGLPGLPQVYVAVPNQASVSLSELLLHHQVDPTTLQPTYIPAPAWVIAHQALQDQIDDIELGAAGDLGREFVFAPAATWNIPVPAGINRRPTVTLYDTTGTEIEADVVCTTTTVTVTFPSPFAGTAVLN